MKHLRQHYVFSRLRAVIGSMMVLGLLVAGAVPAAAQGDPGDNPVASQPSPSAQGSPGAKDETQQAKDSDSAATPSANPDSSASPSADLDSSATPSPDPDSSTTPAASPAATPAAAPAQSIAPFAVPTPSTTQSVITVKVGGVRTSPTAVSGLAGVTLRLYDGTATGPSATPRSEPWATCVSDAAGDCSFIVPDTGPSGANRDDRYWIQQFGMPPANYFFSPTLAVDNPSVSTPYRFRTGTRLRGGLTYSSTVDFMSSSSDTGTASGGIWQVARTNLPPMAQCGLDVALVLDLSGSVSPYIAGLRSAASSFVDALTGTPSSVSLFTFSSVAPAPTGANLAATPVSTLAGAQTVKNRIATYTASGTTNWDRGIYQVATSSTQFDIAVVITDGNPTVYANAEGPGDTTRFREVENGIFSANAVQARGTRIVAVGVGDGVSGPADNLRAISGPTAGSDYIQAASYAAAAAELRSKALGLCQGSVSVVKQVVPASTTGENVTGAQPAGGWDFTVASQTANVTPATQSGTTATLTGAASFPLQYANGVTSGQVLVSETAKSGYDIVTQNGKRAVCRDVETGNDVTVTNDGTNPLGFRVSVPSQNAISCTVYNRAQVARANLSVVHRWVVNGTPYEEGNQPVGLVANLTLDGSAQPWGAARTGLTPGSNSIIAETVNVTGRDLCTIDSSRITAFNSSPVDLPVPSTVSLGSGNNQYTITDTITCGSELTLVKQVQGGPANPTEWTLDAVAPDGAKPGPNGVTGTAGATAEVSPNVRYPLVESGNPLYVQTIRPGGDPIAPSVGSWQCEQVNSSGVVIPGFNDGINGGVSVPLGYRVRCTAVNQTAGLTLIKQVTNDNGGTALPSAWTLTATPQGPVPSGVIAQPVTGSSAGALIQIRPGVTYALSESGPAGYQQTSLQCDTGPNDSFVDATEITLTALDEATCRFVNNDRPARLTLAKTVNNGATGATAVASDWTLSASGPTPITGVTGAAAVTGAEVNIGTYVLSESGPSGYSGSAWTCTGGTLTGASLVLAGGNDVTCSIVNTAVAPQLTLVKHVSNGSSGATTQASAWTLSAAGPVTISGATGTSAVTAAAVQVGTYNLSETGPAGYAAADWVCTGAVSFTASTVTLAPGSQAACTIINSAQLPRLTLVKQVVNNDGGTLGTADFPLTATGPGSTVTGISGTLAVTNVAVPIGTYALSEIPLAPLGYELGSLTCVNGATDLGVSAADPEVDLALGMNVTCTFANADLPARLTLLKEVNPGTSGSSAVPSDWTLTATPNSIDGQSAVTGNGGGAAGGVSVVQVKAGAYTLSETGPSGFDAGSWVCQGAVAVGAVVTVPNGGTVVCTITNQARTPLLTLAKQVQQGDAASVDPATSWVLSANGPTPISGRVNEAAVTAAPVRVGVYALSESSGPAGYLASAWSCTGGTLNGSNLTVAEGQNIVCTITNTAQPSQWTITKTSDPASGATVVAGNTVTYTVSVTHTAGVAPVGVVVTDNLTDVLDDATLGATITPSVGTAQRVGDQLVWTIGSFTGTQTLTYSVVVGGNLDAVLRNVITPPPGATCSGSCQTVHTTARWDVSKTSSPVTGSTVAQGSVVVYTLRAVNSGDVAVADAVVVDDLVDVLDDAALLGPLDPALAFDEPTGKLTWTVPPLAVGAEPVSVSYSVRVNDDAYDTTLRNVVTPTGPGGRCAPDAACTTNHHADRIDLRLAKTHAAIPEDAVDSDKGESVDYVLTVTNSGVDPATNVRVVDELPTSLTLVEGSLDLPDDWTATVANGVITFSYAGTIAPGASVELAFRARVGSVPRESPTGVHLPIDNSACVYTSGDDDSTNDCATDRVEVKSVAIDVAAACVNATPVVTYKVRPEHILGTPQIALIWWTKDAYATRDPNIDASDKAALLADGASKVDTVPVPSGWASGDTISGRLLWPGAAVDADGNPTAWPGWSQLADGTWVLDPSAPFFNLRGETVVEVRINPTTEEVVAYPPPSPNCVAAPTNFSNPDPDPDPEPLAYTGADIAGAGLLAVALVGTGVFLLIRRRGSQLTR